MGNITTLDILNQIQPYSYNYKEEINSPGKKVGVMAQDIEKAGLGSMDTNTSVGKMIDGDQLSGAAMAMIKNLHERIKRIEGK